MNYTYIVECKDGTLYTGWTNNLEKRLRAHHEGKGAKYTKSRRPVTLVYQESFDTKEEAMRREYAIKRFSRKKKMELIERKLKESEKKTGRKRRESEKNSCEVLKKCPKRDRAK